MDEKVDLALRNCLPKASEPNIHTALMTPTLLVLVFITSATDQTAQLLHRPFSSLAAYNERGSREDVRAPRQLWPRCCGAFSSDCRARPLPGPRLVLVLRSPFSHHDRPPLLAVGPAILDIHPHILPSIARLRPLPSFLLPLASSVQETRSVNPRRPAPGCT